MGRDNSMQYGIVDEILNYKKDIRGKLGDLVQGLQINYLVLIIVGGCIGDDDKSYMEVICDVFAVFVNMTLFSKPDLREFFKYLNNF